MSLVRPILTAVVAVQVLALPAFADLNANQLGPNGPPLSLGQLPPLAGDEPVAKEDGGRSPASVGDNPKASRSIASAPNEGDDDEYNFSWLDPDKKVYVLQNRKYRKKNRFAVFLSAGADLSNPFRTEYEIVPRADYWFSEQFGVEAFYGALTNSDSSTLTALKNVSTSALPFVRENRSFFGGALTWTPWYAKLNFFNKILYFDWFLLGGVGQTVTAVNQTTKVGLAPNFAIQNLFTEYFGTGHEYYVTHNFIVRLDFFGMMYSATGADGSTTQNQINWEFTAGVGWAF